MNGDFTSAVDYAKSAVLYGSEDPEAYNNLGNALKDVNLIDEAIKYYKKSYWHNFFNRNNSFLIILIISFSIFDDFEYFFMGTLWKGLNKKMQFNLRQFLWEKSTPIYTPF